MDVEMAEHDDSMNNTTITQSTLQQHAPQAPLQQPPQPVYQPQPPYQQPPYHHQQQPYQPQYDANNGYAAAGAVQDPMHYGASNNPPAQHGFPRPTTAHSDTPFSRSAGYQPYSDQDSTPPYRRGGVTQQQQQQQPAPQKMPSRPPSGMSGSVQYGQQPQDQSPGKNPSVVIKVGMVGDAQIGKTSLMVKYVEGSWDEDYIQTLGVNFMEKTISIRNTEITFSIWDLGGQREFVNMLPLVCNDAVAILFMFDLTRKSTLNSIKEWYRQGRGFNKTAIPFLVGTKYDTFVNFPIDEQEEISSQAKKFARAMKASLIFSSTSHGINVQKIFKIVLSKAFDLRCTIPEISNVGEPLLLYQAL